MAIATHCPDIEHLSLSVSMDRDEDDFVETNGGNFKKLKVLELDFWNEYSDLVEFIL